MAYNSGSVFGGYAGGYTQTPGGFILPSNANPLGVGYPAVPGANLPSVDPNLFPGAVHYGPATTLIGPASISYPANAGYVDPNLGLYGASNFNGGFY